MLYYVSDGLESKDGSSGWDTEYYGPFFSLEHANEFARSLAADGYGEPEHYRLIEVRENDSRHTDEDSFCPQFARRGFRWRGNRDDAEAVIRPACTFDREAARVQFAKISTED